MSLVLTSGPAAEPVHRTEMKLHLRVDGTDEHSLIDSLSRGARQWIEGVINRQLVTATLVLRRSSFASPIVLPRPPLQSVTSVTYVDAAGDTQTASSALYDVVPELEPGHLRLAYGQSWPTTRGHTDDVAVTYKAGYSSVVTAVVGTDVLTCAAQTFTDADIVRVWNSGGALPAPLAINTDYHVRDQATTTFKLAATAGGAAIDLTTAGTGANFVGEMPEALRSAIKLLTGHLFENREAVTVGPGGRVMPMAVESLIDPYRIWWEEF